MDNNTSTNIYQGDLADIIRATTTTSSDGLIPKWRFGSLNSDEYELKDDDLLYQFPVADTLLDDMDAITTTSTTFLNDLGIEHSSKGVVQVTSSNNSLCNIYSSNIAQISQDSDARNNDADNLLILPAPAVAVKTGAGFGFMSDQMISINANCSSSLKVGGFVDTATATTSAQLQIPSPRNPGIKRRKIQAKKVVCIPAPAAANSRQTGEVVPSDLWAWRKYGQKPIKGSPYPRGYYRCSSSKGCSARKQVERSRTDPNMLVITYTSEHNHPWPTQRNALAGSTRSSQPASKTSSKASPPPLQNPSIDNFRNVLIKEDNNTPTLSIVKEEEEIRLTDDRIEQRNKVDEIIESYRPLILQEPKIIGHNDQQADQDFFADLVEFDSDDPLELFGAQNGKGFDSFSGLFDWATNNNTTTNDEDNVIDHTTTFSSQEENFKGEV